MRLLSTLKSLTIWATTNTTLKEDLMSGHVFIFWGRSGSQVKLLWSTGDGRKRPARAVFPLLKYLTG
ncbi:IS66 family insertion sequence element accessory protein TnpB [Enterobacter sp. WCHEn045836]|uniref:IS66 family insertion sequence element accessory protein TnpB n=1 Tax=Enterobacter sp. WCHEn045836 TaxID=2497434 RepID=UPI00163980E2|nr:IS66 family insertion sequence element accessory protein TnpB [Enterobacter sp. WCHEn045836]